MFRHLLLALGVLCSLSSCITFNTGAKLDSIGKAVPATMIEESTPQFYKLNGVIYKEVMVQYRQPNPHLIGTAYMGYWDTKGNPLPPVDATGAPGPELYLVRLNADRTDMPSFIRAIEFDYAQASPVGRNEVGDARIPYEYFRRWDWLTLTPSQNDRNHDVDELPSIRTTGNIIRMPASVLLSYGVDLPLTAVSYTVAGLLQLPLLLFATF